MGQGQNLQAQSSTSWPGYSSPPNQGFQQNTQSQSSSAVITNDGPSSTQLQCPYCPNVYSKQYKLNKHLKVHDKPSECGLCQFKTAEVKDLNRHLWSHHRKHAASENIPNSEGVCGDCGQKCTRSDNLMRHQKRHKHGIYADGG